MPAPIENAGGRWVLACASGRIQGGGPDADAEQVEDELGDEHDHDAGEHRAPGDLVQHDGAGVLSRGDRAHVRGISVAAIARGVGMMGVGHGEASCSAGQPPGVEMVQRRRTNCLAGEGFVALAAKIARSSGARNPWGERPLVLAYQRAAMGDPTHPSSVPPHDAEPVPSLDDAPRSGAGTEVRGGHPAG